MVSRLARALAAFRDLEDRSRTVRWAVNAAWIIGTCVAVFLCLGGQHP